MVFAAGGVDGSLFGRGERATLCGVVVGSGLGLT